MSVKSYYNKHYQKGHNKERRQNNKRPKGSVAEEVVERPSKRSNCSILDEFDRNNDITVAHYSVKFDGVHHEGDDDDYVTNDSFDVAANTLRNDQLLTILLKAKLSQPLFLTDGRCGIKPVFVPAQIVKIVIRLPYSPGISGIQLNIAVHAVKA